MNITGQKGGWKVHPFLFLISQPLWIKMVHPPTDGTTEKGDYEDGKRIILTQIRKFAKSLTVFRLSLVVSIFTTNFVSKKHLNRMTMGLERRECGRPVGWRKSKSGYLKEYHPEICMLEYHDLSIREISRRTGRSTTTLIKIKRLFNLWDTLSYTSSLHWESWSLTCWNTSWF